MLDMNQNMDELFRRAAKDYPLDTGIPDFNMVLSKMQEAGSAPPKKPGNNNSKWLLPFWLLMLLPIALIHHFNPQVSKTAGLSQQSASVASGFSINQEEKSISGSTTNSTGQPGPGETVITPRAQYGSAITGSLVNSAGAESNRRTKSSNAKQSMQLTITAPDADSEQQYAGIPFHPEISAVVEKKSAFIPVEVTENEIWEMPEEIKYKEPVAADTVAAPVEKKSKNKRFYAGVTGGADLTSIKMQSVKKTGYSAGIVAGYEINKNWSIESGVLYNKKYYSTDGKYFNPKYALPYNATIEYADGNCNMLEVPLNVRYNFSPARKLSWYVLSGFSSYFMKEEAYVYDVNHNGYRYPKAVEYYNPATSLFSVVNFAGGFSYRLGGFNLGLEPYVKLPIRKVGTGNLPLQSGGINIRITTKIF